MAATIGPATDWLRRLSKSSTDVQIGGVCGGLGEHTPIPTWAWRMLFLGLLLSFGAGVIPYLLLWICLPESKTADHEQDSSFSENPPSDDRPSWHPPAPATKSNPPQPSRPVWNSGQHLFGKSSVVGDAGFAHQGWISGKALDPRLSIHLEHAGQVGPVRKELDP